MGVDGGSKWRTGTRKADVRLDEWCELVKVALGNRGMTANAALHM